jgi:hypothetical protein
MRDWFSIFLLNRRKIRSGASDFFCHGKGLAKNLLKQIPGRLRNAGELLARTSPTTLQSSAMRVRLCVPLQQRQGFVVRIAPLPLLLAREDTPLQKFIQLHQH